MAATPHRPILRNGSRTYRTSPEREQRQVHWNLPGMDESSSGDEESNGSIPTPIVPSFRLATLNITDGRKSRLNAAIRCMEQANVDVGLLTETKLSNDMYTKSAMGYTVSATKAVGMNGGVALVHQLGKGWGLESIRCFWP